MTDLLLDLDQLITLLADQVDSAGWLDAYLLCAGALQVLEDHRVPGSLWRGRAMVHLGGRPSLSGRLGKAAVGVAQWVEQTRHEASTAAQWCAGLRRELIYLADVLAQAVLDGEEVDEAAAAVLAARAHAVRTVSSGPPAVSRTLARHPSAFRSFDQHPDDVAELVRRFAVLSPQRDVPVLAVGVRTSGSYLAPLAAAALRREGFADVGWLTIRPGIAPGRPERRTLQRIAGCAGQALVLDDPPTTGSSVAATVASLCRSGIAAHRITLLLAVLDSDGRLPVRLDAGRRVTLPWPDWTVHQRLREESVATTLPLLLSGQAQVLGVERQSPPGPPARGHVRAHYRVRLKDAATSEVYDRDVAVEGAGIGYFGRHALAVAQALSGWVPDVLGFADGLLYRVWLPARSRPATPPPAAVVAEYVVARHRNLPAAQDQSRHLRGCQPVWEVAARILSRGFGRAAVLGRGALVEPTVRGLLRVERPSIIDGRMDPACWALEGGKPTKVTFAEGAFSNYDLCCYDPVFDLAGAATVTDSVAYGSVLLDAFVSLTGEAVDEERWLLYQLVHLWNAGRMDPGQRWRASVEQAAAMQRYLASVFLSDLTCPDSGPLCAIDVDGVLESETFGFPASTTAGMLALRALQTHGYRAFLATGRSLPEVRQRCAAYGLVGGVAEYGTVLYDHRAREAIRLTSDEVQDQTDQLRGSLGQLPELEVDPWYRHVVRLRRHGADGRTEAVPEAMVATQLPSGAAGAGWRVVVGDGQTDLVPPGVDKGRAALALVQRADPGEADQVRPLRLAVGDTATDVPLFALASLPLAVGNASAAVRASSTPVLRDAYQAGLAAAVGRLIGHPAAGARVAVRLMRRPPGCGSWSCCRSKKRAGPGWASVWPPSRRGEYGEVVAEGSPPMAASPFNLGPLTPGRQKGAAPDRMRRDGHTLTASSAVTAALGLLYWAVAARRYGSATVGRNAAAISAMMFLAGVAQLNLMSALVRFVPTAGARGSVLVRRAYLVSTGVALLVGVSFLAVLNHLAASLHPLLGSPLIVVWFVLCTMAWTVFTMQDSVLAGIRRAWLVPAENAAYSLAKVVLVVLLASRRPGDGIFLSWTLALAVSVIPVNWYLFRRGMPRHPATSTESLPDGRDLARFVVKDYCGSLCWIAATSLIPLVVIDLAGARASAYFTLPWQLAYMLYLVSANMGTALVIEAAADQSHLAARWRATVIHTLKLLGPVSLVLVIAAPEILSIFGSSYAQHGTTLLRLLALSALPNLITASAVSACRAQRRTELAFTVLASICIPVFVISAVMIPVVGVAGVGWAWLLSQGLVSVMLLVGRSWWLPAAGPDAAVARRRGRAPAVISPMAVRAGRRLKPLLAPVQRGRASWKRRQLSGLCRAVMDSLAAGPEAQLFAGSPRLQMISNESALSVATVAPPGEAPSGVLKIARSPEAIADLRAQRRNLSTLHADERLGQWRDVLPQVLSWGERGSFDFSIENCLAARDARAVIAVRRPTWARLWSKNDQTGAQTSALPTGGSPDTLLNRAMVVIGDLHRRTAEKTVIDKPFLAQWVDAPLAAVDTLYPGVNRFCQRHQRLLLLRGQLHAALADQAVELSWTHGDFTLGNIVVGGDPATVVGVVDWGSVSAGGLPELDTYHLWLTAHAEATGREFGELVIESLCSGGLDRDPSLARTSQLRHRDIVLLTWLNHVAHNIQTNRSYRRQRFWRIANVDIVLDVLTD